MVGIKRLCDNCNGEYFVKLLKVYVFKERQCPKCGTTMFADNDKHHMTCKKCGHKVSFDDKEQLGSMPVRIRGTSRDINVVAQMKREGIEIDKQLIPKNHYCQRCRNLQNIMSNMARGRGKGKGARELPIEDLQRIIRYQVQNKLQRDQQQKLQEEERKKEEEFKKAKLLEMAVEGAQSLKEKGEGIPLISTEKGGAELMREEVKRLTEEQARGKKDKPLKVEVSKELKKKAENLEL